MSRPRTSGSWLVFVESNTTGTGRRFCAAARDRGLRPVILSRDPDRYPYVRQDGIDAVRLDTSDPRAVLETCQGLREEGGLAGVGSSSEYFIALAASTARSLGLAGPDPNAVERCRDKSRQRAVLAEAGVRVPDFTPVQDPAAAVLAAADMGLPVVVKPVKGSGSVGVLLCESAEAVSAQAADLLASAGLDQNPRVLVEKYVTGPEYSVETMDGRVVMVVGKHLGAPPHFVEVGHDIPAQVSADDRERLVDETLAAVQALGLGWGPVHTELRMGPAGPVVIEVNPRLAGGMIPVAIERAGGGDLVDATVARISGQPMPEIDGGAGYAAIRFLLVSRSGVLRELADPGPALSVPGVALAEYSATAGGSVEITHSFKDRIGLVIALGPDGSRAGRAAEQGIARLGAEFRENPPRT